MATAAVIQGDAIIQGNAYVGGIIPLAGAGAYLTDALVSATAAIDSTKVKVERQCVVPLQNHGSTPTAVRKTIGRCRRAGGGVIVGVSAGVVQVISAGSLTVDVYKNGTTILTGVVTLNTSAGSGGTAYDTVAGTLAVTALAAGDVLEVVLAVSGLTGGGGLFVEVTTKET